MEKKFWILTLTNLVLLLFSAFWQVAPFDPNLKLIFWCPSLERILAVAAPTKVIQSLLYHCQNLVKYILLKISLYKKRMSGKICRKKGMGVERSKVKGEKESKCRGINWKDCLPYVKESLWLEIVPILFSFQWNPLCFHTGELTQWGL